MTTTDARLTLLFFVTYVSFRYKQEILRLRKLVGSEAPRAFSAGASDPHLMQRSKRTTSHEL